MIYPGEPIEYALRERGYEWEFRDGLYVFRKVIDQNDISRALEDCFGKGRKEVAVASYRLTYLNVKKFIAWLDSKNWQ